MKRFYCVILAMLAVILYAIVMSGCRAISSNVEVATQPVVETPLAEHKLAVVIVCNRKQLTRQVLDHEACHEVFRRVFFRDD